MRIDVVLFFFLFFFLSSFPFLFFSFKKQAPVVGTMDWELHTFFLLLRFWRILGRGPWN